MDTLSVRFHFGGKFSRCGNEVHYRGGRSEISVIDRDNMSLFELKGYLRDDHQCVVNADTLLHWLLPGKDLNTGLRVVDDETCLLMSDCIVEGHAAEVYVGNPPPAAEEIADDDIHEGGSDHEIEIEEIGEESGAEAYAMEEPAGIERQASRPMKRAGKIERQVKEREFYSRPLKRAGKIERQVKEREFYSRPFKRAGMQAAHKEAVDSGSFTCAPPGGMGKDDGGSKKRARVDEDDGGSDKRARVDEDGSSSEKRACIDGNDASTKKRACTDEEDGAIRVAKRAHISSGGGVSDAAADNSVLETDGPVVLASVPFEDAEWIRDNYIVAEDIDPKTMLSKIENVLKEAALSLAKGDGYSYEVPARNSQNLSYRDTHGIIHKRGELVPFDFSKNFCKAIQLTCALSVVAELIKNKVPLPKRFVFYRYREVFGSYEVACTMLDHICCMFGCNMSSLNISMERKGCVIGPLKVKLTNGQILDCSVDLDGEGQKIPRTLSIESFENDDAKQILVVEKKTIFNYLLRTRFHIEQKCIMITGSGEADIATRGFLNRLHAATKLPVYAFVDPDPYGVQILFVYAFGSVNLSYANYGLAVPEIQWIGLWHSDLQDVNLRDTYFSDTTPREKNMLNNLLGQRILPAHWEPRMRPMLKRKSSLEALFSVDFFYLSKVLLPKLLAQKDSEPTQLDESTETEEIMVRIV